MLIGEAINTNFIVWFDPIAERIVKPLYPMRNITLLDHTIVTVNHKFNGR